MDICTKCGKILSASSDSGTMCAKCLKDKQDEFWGACNTPAFPCVPQDRSGQIAPMYYGLTKREWFAGMAMQGMLANRNSDINLKDAYDFADKMIQLGMQS